MGIAGKIFVRAELNRVDEDGDDDEPGLGAAEFDQPGVAAMQGPIVGTRPITFPAARAVRTAAGYRRGPRLPGPQGDSLYGTGPMRALRIVQARVGDLQVAEDLAPDQGLGNNAGNVFDLHMPVPDPLGIDDHRRPVLALFEATRVIGPGQDTEPRLFQFLLECVAERLASFGVAAAPLVAGGANVTADEDVLSERRHDRPCPALVDWQRPAEQILKARTMVIPAHRSILVTNHRWSRPPA